MSAVDVREFKNRLTHYLQLTINGVKLIVTEQGVPITLLQHITSTKQATSLSARLARISALGMAGLPQKRLPKRVKTVQAEDPPASHVIREDRR